MHPLDTLIFSNIVAVAVGVALGIVAFFAGVKAAEFSIDGSNVILVGFIFTTVHLQHSQFWIAFPGISGRIFMSPAHHQIHHSADPAHFNANYGSCLAIFDWAYGSLLMPSRENPRLRYGVIEDGKDPHGMRELLAVPLIAFVARIAEAAGLRRAAAQPMEKKCQTISADWPDRRPRLGRRRPGRGNARHGCTGGRSCFHGR